MEIFDARRIVSADKRGSSWPVLVETDAGLWFTKLRGAAQGTGALVAEVIVAELAEALGLRVPTRSLVRLHDDVESVDRNDELADLLRASAGINLGFVHLEGARDFDPQADVPRVSSENAAPILWLDGLTTNPDRTGRNPNLLWQEDALWLIDHGAALGFQYALPAVDFAWARRPYALREPHLLQSRVADGDMAARDTAFASRVTHEVIARAVASVPDEFLLPLLRDETIASRRAAYIDFLSRRLEAPRPFLAPLPAPNEQRRRGRPAWLGQGR